MLSLIVDDDEIFCRALCRNIDGKKLVAHDLATGIELCRLHHPHVVVLDVILPDAIGWQHIREFIAASPGTEIVVLTSCTDRIDGLRAVAEMGAYCYLDKIEGMQKIRAAVIGAFVTCLASMLNQKRARQARKHRA
jgi:ActR/RegA family two-component response regulator